MRLREFPLLQGLGVVNGVDLDQHAGFLRAQVLTFCRRRGKHGRADELVGPAWGGMRRAAERFNHAGDAKFTTFAAFAIRGAIVDYLRDVDSQTVPRLVRMREKRGELKARRTLHFSALEHANERGLHDSPPVEIAAKEEPRAAEAEELAAVLFRGLDGRDLFIARSYLLEGYICSEIGAALGLTESRIAQELKRIRRKKGWPTKGGKVSALHRTPRARAPDAPTRPLPVYLVPQGVPRHRDGRRRRRSPEERAKIGAAVRAALQRRKLELAGSL
jgi:RNA polymerase sigma factor (sigma-70 family)